MTRATIFSALEVSGITGILGSSRPDLIQPASGSGRWHLAPPTWRVLQRFAIRGMCAVLNERPPAMWGESLDSGLAAEAGEGGFRLHLTW